MLDHKIVVRKDGWIGGCLLLHVYDREEAETEAEKFRKGPYLADIINHGFKVYVEEVKDDR